jgi:hypothetical protein
MKAKLIILTAASLILLGGTGCTIISEETFLGKQVERQSTPFKRSHYVETRENGRVIYRLSTEGKAAVAKEAQRYKNRKTARQARRNISKPITHLVDWTASTVTLPFELHGGSWGRAIGASEKSVPPIYP